MTITLSVAKPLSKEQYTPQLFEMVQADNKRAFDALTDNAKKVFRLFEQIQATQGQHVATIYVQNTSRNIHLTEDEFMAALNEIVKKNHFMYIKNGGTYVFSNSRMVF